MHTEQQWNGLEHFTLDSSFCPGEKAGADRTQDGSKCELCTIDILSAKLPNLYLTSQQHFTLLSRPRVIGQTWNKLVTS